MAILSRTFFYKLIKGGGASPSRLKFLLVLSSIYVLIRFLLTWNGYPKAAGENGLPASNSTGLAYDDIHIGITSLTGFLNALKVDTEYETVHIVPAISVGDRVPNCGLQDPCSEDSFAVHIFTGQDHHDQPRLCVDGKYILGTNLNNGGRGINVAVIDSVTRFVQRVSHFDTYEEDSSQLETLLLNLRQGDILILLTFDEPTRKLSQIARLLLHELGSAMAQNLHYRSSWYFITQKGISGFSPYEDLHFVEAKGWAVPHDIRMCVPFKLSGRTIHPDPRPQENLKRRQFCTKYQHFPSFCSGDLIDNPLVPNPSVKFTNSKIFTTPVIVMSGEVIHHLPLTLETLIMQPGIDPRHVLVFHVPEHPEVRDLCELFGFTAEQMDNSNLAKSCDQFTEAFDTAERQFPDAVHFVVIEEGVILAPDFLAYLAQLLPLLDLDSTISSISAWNDNGFEGVSGKSRRVYRVESLTGLAFLVRRGFPAQGWCERRFEQRPEGSPSGGDSLSPDASRVVRLSDMPLEVEASSEVFEALVARGRVTDMELGVILEDIDKLERSRYERLLHDLLSTSLTWALNREYLATCNVRTRLPRPPASATTERHAVSLYFDQNSPDDIESLRSLCSCFGLFHHPKFYPRGLYRGMLRFTWEDYDVFLIGRYSPYYKFKPKNISPLSLERAVSG
ncbi:unnamed protein product [Ixodes persulcatus]